MGRLSLCGAVRIGHGEARSLPVTKAAGGAMNVMSGQRVDPTVLARETTGLLRRARTSAME
jgi:hypothetical protein